MAPVTDTTSEANEPASPKAKLRIKLNVKPPAKAETEVEAPKASDEEFLLTLLDTVKVNHQAAANILGINKAACRMRFIRLQQKYGFKKKGPKGTPRRKKGAAMVTPANEADVAEGGD
ncbi:hypothetical protein DTO013E5_4655 [Penicillium roqueforti]|uniref:uncharacterized protein n=1 Tax=Penicillium roqueforti TaxID=5082 RepID=UPI00190D67CF|nr:uncharacterized protein LCP9604111_6315 [Penicillium roqueforti]KAF9247616.1 hypothetical protein LCP9604111_6315 [Penicillium roqueforti]KAI2676796.1 hypothetical protein CBS147355_5898 [Penicillium roqueforti]KAI2683670.1 hypothetical protein LCP963914a_6071 [Penicillium roqueforti]KAI2703115.1 hypothetical protein CBS147372_3430 [Penicillium roqueforti]KAI2708500.1 hypothetical protein CBS147332_6561 [Penicillium roqueforti]